MDTTLPDPDDPATKEAVLLNAIVTSFASSEMTEDITAERTQMYILCHLSLFPFEFSNFLTYIFFFLHRCVTLYHKNPH